MKRCPKCQTDYFDNMLDFCMDDGEKFQILKSDVKRKDNLPTQAETLAFNAAKNSIPTRAVSD